jgi:hypothetical protein
MESNYITTSLKNPSLIPLKLLFTIRSYAFQVLPPGLVFNPSHSTPSGLGITWVSVLPILILGFNQSSLALPRV